MRCSRLRRAPDVAAASRGARRAARPLKGGGRAAGVARRQRARRCREPAQRVGLGGGARVDRRRKVAAHARRASASPSAQAASMRAARVAAREACAMSRAARPRVQPQPLPRARERTRHARTACGGPARGGRSG